MFNKAIYCVIVLICVKKSISSQLDTAPMPKEEFALSLWLITRTGWVYCERTEAYLNAVEQSFDVVNCKKCYFNLFENYKTHPSNVTDADILKCARNFRASLTPSMPFFTGSERRQPSLPSFGFLRQLNPLETAGVRAFTCNSEVSQNSSLSMDQIIMPTVASIFQLFSTRQFSSGNDPKRQFSRKSYVDCLFGKLFEIEFALCPINAARRRCALQSREADEALIFSTDIPIRYNLN